MITAPVLTSAKTGQAGGKLPREAWNKYAGLLYGCGSKLNHKLRKGTAGFRSSFHSPGQPILGLPFFSTHSHLGTRSRGSCVFVLGVERCDELQGQKLLCRGELLGDSQLVVSLADWELQPLCLHGVWHFGEPCLGS